MAFTYSSHSKRQLKTLHPYLRLCFLKLLLVHDYRIDQGGRTEAQQLAFFKSGVSKLKPPKGKHLIRKRPGDDAPWSYAADACPYIKGKRLATGKRNFKGAQKAQFARFLALMESIGRTTLEGSGYQLRFGVNWDMDEEILTDQKFQDWFHVELVKASG